MFNKCLLMKMGEGAHTWGWEQRSGLGNAGGWEHGGVGRASLRDVVGSPRSLGLERSRWREEGAVGPGEGGVGGGGSSSHKYIFPLCWPMPVSICPGLGSVPPGLALPLVSSVFLGFWPFLYSSHIRPCLLDLSVFPTPCLGGPHLSISLLPSACLYLSDLIFPSTPPGPSLSSLRRP